MNNHQEITYQELIDSVKKQLEIAHYSPVTIAGFVPVWDRLVNYMTQNGNEIFTAKTGMDFLEAEYGITVYGKLSQKNKRCARAINLLSDYLLHGVIFPRTKLVIRTYHPQFQVVFQGFINTKKANGFSHSTLQSYEIYLSRFSDHLNSHGIASIHDLDDIVVLGFIETFTRYSPSVIHNTLCSLRTFFHYLFENGFVSYDFAYIGDGRRDTVLLSLLYDSGARVQELADLKVSDIRIATPSTIKLTGKGNKQRIVPLMKPMSALLDQYMKESDLTEPYTFNYPLFSNRSKDKLTRAGIAYIVKKYANRAIKEAPEMFPDKFSPHCFRHSKAVHLLQSGVNLIYIRDFLGHVDIKTTEIYARIDGEMKRKALEKSTINIVSDKMPEWQSNKELMNWLKNLGK